MIQKQEDNQHPTAKPQRGDLMVEDAVWITIAPLLFQTTIKLSNNMDCNTEEKVPIAISMYGWTYIHKLQTTVVED